MAQLAHIPAAFPASLAMVPEDFIVRTWANCGLHPKPTTENDHKPASDNDVIPPAAVFILAAFL